MKKHSVSLTEDRSLYFPVFTCLQTEMSCVEAWDPWVSLARRRGAGLSFTGCTGLSVVRAASVKPSHRWLLWAACESRFISVRAYELCHLRKLSAGLATGDTGAGSWAPSSLVCTRLAQPSCSAALLLWTCKRGGRGLWAGLRGWRVNALRCLLAAVQPEC